MKREARTSSENLIFHPWRKAFTLVELLVMVALIALLTSILAPSLSQARLLGRQAACGCNLRAIGGGATLYQADFEEQVPICWRNVEPDRPNPWPSWRAALRPYVSTFKAFNCTAAQGTDDGRMGVLFTREEDLYSQEKCGTANAGSYGAMHLFALPSYKTEIHDGEVERGHPCWSPAFSTRPGEAWADPADSVYIADAIAGKGEITYPSVDHKPGLGTSFIMPPGDPLYAHPKGGRRFADRHRGTNCLFLDGRVERHDAWKLEAMQEGASNCLWDRH